MSAATAALEFADLRVASDEAGQTAAVELDLTPYDEAEWQNSPTLRLVVVVGTRGSIEYLRSRSDAELDRIAGVIAWRLTELEIARLAPLPVRLHIGRLERSDLHQFLASSIGPHPQIAGRAVDLSRIESLARGELT